MQTTIHTLEPFLTTLITTTTSQISYLGARALGILFVKDEKKGKMKIQ